MAKGIQNKKLFYSSIIIILFHIIGVIGINSSYSELFIHLSSVNLLLSFIILTINQNGYNNSFWLFMLISVISGYFIEVIGVKAGLIFGEYQYGESLGIKLLNVPLIIGINWFMLLYSVGCILNKIHVNIILKSLLGAIMLVLLDILIEPVAIKLDFWDWNNHIIPIQNYLGWFIFSFILLLIFNKFEFNKNNLITQTFYITQLVFFALIKNL